MAAPPEQLGTHDRGSNAGGDREELGQSNGELLTGGVADRPELHGVDDVLKVFIDDCVDLQKTNPWAAFATQGPSIPSYSSRAKRGIVPRFSPRPNHPPRIRSRPSSS